MARAEVNVSALFFLWEIKRRFGTLEGKTYLLYKIYMENFDKISKATFYRYAKLVDDNFKTVHSFFESVNLRDKL